MEEIVNVLMNNGIGFASFVALIYFMNTSLKEIKASNEEISKTLITIQTSLIQLTERVSDIEKDTKKG